MSKALGKSVSKDNYFSKFDEGAVVFTSFLASDIFSVRKERVSSLPHLIIDRGLIQSDLFSSFEEKGLLVSSNEKAISFFLEALSFRIGTN